VYSYREIPFTKPFIHTFMMKQLFFWLLALTAAQAQTTPNDATLVRQVIEGETRAYLTANADQIFRSWAYDKPYVERQGIEVKPFANGLPYLKGTAAMHRAHDQLKTMLKDQGNTLRISDYEAHPTGNVAWATYTQEVVDKAGAVIDKTRQARILERQSDGWKIVFMSAQPMP